MKGELGRKIFKMIGIVLGSALGFTGTVVGVMAAMGKFKTPIVYPTVLGFAETEQTIIEGITYDPSIDWDIQFEDAQLAPKIESFSLVGKNPKSEHEVNKTKCYLWFENNASSKLITLCDKNGKPLSKDKNNRYLVDCNEPIYYMVNKVAGDAQIDGEVIINARSTNETLKRPESPLKIYIDREVESVFVKDWGGTSSINGVNTQSITLGVDMEFIFDYSVTTELSLKPITKESAKEIELFYDVTNLETDFGTDYFIVDEEACSNNNSSSPVANVLEYEDGKFVFKSSIAGTHKFIIGIFPTYKAKTDYEAEISGLEFDNPNYHRTQRMLTTELTVNVANIDISKVEFNGSGDIVLDLYSENDYIYLHNPEAEKNNLGLYMQKTAGDNTVDDFTRLNEVNMDGFTGDVWSESIASFGDIVWNIENSTIVNENDIAVVGTGKFIGENLEIVNYIYKTSNPEELFYCNNGMAVRNTTTKEIKLLKAGSYLNFYIYDETNGSYHLADFEYSLTESGIGKDKKWNITTKSLPNLNENQTLQMCILVVNNSTEFKIENFFDSIRVNLNPVDFAFDYVDYDGTSDSVDAIFNASEKTLEMSIGFTQVAQTYPSLAYDKIIANIVGSYNSFVYVIEQKENNIVNTLSGIQLIVGEGETAKTYSIVGYLNGNQFVNEIKLNDKVSKDNQTCEIRMFRFENGYNQTIEDIFDEVLQAEDANRADILNSKKIGLYGDAITISADYKLNTELLKYTHGQPSDTFVLNPEVYENTGEHTISILSSNEEMLSKIMEFYGISNETISEYFKVTSDYSERITLSNVQIKSGVLSVDYQVGEELAKPKTISVWLDVKGVTFDLGEVSILSAVPKNIILRTTTGDILLDSVASGVKNTIQAILGWDGTALTYSFTINGISIDATHLFNNSTDGFATTGFQDQEVGINKGNLRVSYKVDDRNKSLFNTDKITFNDGVLSLLPGLIGGSTGEGSIILQVEISAKSGTAVGYINVQTITDRFTLETAKENQTTYDCYESATSLSDYITYQYNNPDGTELTLNCSTANMVEINNVECISYGDGKLIASYDETEKAWSLKKDEENATAVLTISDSAYGWTFQRTNSNIALSIKFEVKTVAGTQELTINFVSNINISVNLTWEDRTIYAGTTVELDSIFSIDRRNDDKSLVQFVLNGNTLDEEFVVTNYGTINIIPKIGGVETGQKFSFMIVPNVIATIKNSSLNSQSNYELSDIYTLQKFDTTITYGSVNLYTKKEYYTDDTYTTLSDEETIFVKSVPNSEFLVELSAKDSDVDNLVFKVENSIIEPTISGGTTLIVGEMTELGVEKQQEITLAYMVGEDEYVLREDTFDISNFYKVQKLDTDGVDEKELTFKALKEYLVFAKVDEFSVKSIVADNLLININDGNFTIVSIVNQVLTDVEVVVTFVKDDQELTYTTEITILPYTPEQRTDLTTAYSGSFYDLFGGIYEIDAITNDSLVEKLWTTGIKLSENGEDVANSLVSDWVEGGGGYTKGIANPSYEIVFNEIDGESLKVLVEFTITYSNASTYTFYIPLEIVNRQDITEPTYPEDDRALTYGYFKFASGYEEDALSLSGLSEAPTDGIYRLTNVQYEPILIYTNASRTLNFKFDEYKKMSRVAVENKLEANTSYSKSTDLKIELIAYQTRLASYIQNINVDFATNEVWFATGEEGIFGTIIFKLSTVSGNYVYYNVYVYCDGAMSTTSINHENNLEALVYDASIMNTLDSTLTVKGVNSGVTTYSALVESLNEDFESTFKTEFDGNTTKIYLYNIEATGGEADTGFYFTEVSEKTITINEMFNTITLGLVIVDGVEEYCFGTITLYVQPNIAISIDAPEVLSTFTFNLPNGNFVSNIVADASEVSCPFGTDWKAEIESVNGNTEFDTSKYWIDNDSVLELGERVSVDTIIKVKYSNNNTIIYVLYTYLATVIPSQTSNVITLGQFNSTDKSFTNSIGITSNDKVMSVANKEYFFGTYNSAYTVSLGETATEGNTFGIDVEEISGVKFVDEVLTFPQGTSEQNFKITITYLNYGDENRSRTFTFKILPGVNFVSTSANDSGATASTRVSTLASGNYKETTGSTLDITRSTIGDTTKYEVAGLSIYTNADSKLELTFDESDYVVGLSSLSINSDATINFVHSAINKPIIMTIKVLASDSATIYGQRNLYINVVQTYTSLKAVYLTAGADHENVKSNSTMELHSELLSSKRIVLLGTTYDSTTLSYNTISDTNLDLMGFITAGNPNQITFSLGMDANATLQANSGYQTIKFNTVTANTMCYVYLNNNAGLEADSVRYAYQIMAGDYVDGLNYNATTGYNGTDETTPYLSFLLEDKNHEEAYSNTFVVGKMLDLKNNSIFTVTETDPNWTKSAITDEDGNSFDCYTATYENYELKLIFNTNNNNIELTVVRNANTIQDNRLSATGVLDVSFGGVNGDKTIVKNLKLVLTNHQIDERYNATNDSVYAGNKVKLFEDSDTDGIYDNGKFVENSGTSEPSLSYILADSSYTLNGQVYTILSSQTTNNLFVYDATNKTIQTNAVASDISAVINFLVKEGDFVVKTVTYKVNIHLNMKFVVNGDETSTLETNLVLTNKETENAEAYELFPIVINFIDGDAIGTNDYKKESTGTYYKVLAYDLFRINSQLNDYVISKDNVTVKLFNEAYFDGILEVSDDGITFYKDYSGEIELELSVSTKNGTYTVYWTIYVTPMLDIEIAKDSIISTLSSSAFNSGTSVGLVSTINKKADEGVGIVVSRPSENFTKFINYGTINIYYNYKIFTYDTQSNIGGLKNSDLYVADATEEFKNYYIASGNGTSTLGNDNKCDVTLPIVPSTLASQSYLVVYEVYFEYAGLTKDDNKVELCYVTYEVINRQQVNAYSYKQNPNDTTSISSANVDVTTGVNADNTLDLFYYDGSNTYYVDEDNKIHSVFESNFTSAVEYENFIKLYLYDKTNNDVESVKIGDKTFKLIKISDERYGINLYEDNEWLFNNELTETLSLIVDGVETITLNNFRLYAKNSIIANTSYSIAGMGLSNYFTPEADWDSNLMIIGVGDPSLDWVSEASLISSIGTTADGTISIPNGNGNNEYELRKVTYTGEGGGDYYSVTQSYYYICGDSLVVPSYTGVESYLYSVAYKPNDNGDVVLNLSNAVKVWAMGTGDNAGKLVNSSDSVSYADFTVINPTSGITNPIPDYVNKTLTLSAEVLRNYKSDINPTAKSYPTITATISVNGTTTLQLVIEYALPNE